VEVGDEVGVVEGVSVERLALDGARHCYLPSQGSERGTPLKHATSQVSPVHTPEVKPKVKPGACQARDRLPDADADDLVSFHGYLNQVRCEEEAM